MRIHNIFHFTENHRYVVMRDFSLSPFDDKVLQLLYQPMIGMAAFSLYMALYHQLPQEQYGYSKPEQQRRLFLSLDLEPSESGRKSLAGCASKLEAIGLLNTYRIYVPHSDETLYEYVLHQPLSPAEFFKNQHLTLLLQDKVGKHMLLAVKDTFYREMPPELSQPSAAREDLSTPFYDLFQLDARMLDYEIEQAIEEIAVTVPQQQHVEPKLRIEGWSYADILSRFPKDAANRPYIETLRFEPEQLDGINYVSRKYDLSLVELCRLLDEDGIFDSRGKLQLDALQHKARYVYHQHKNRQESRERFLHKATQPANTPEAPEEKQVAMDYYLEVPEMLHGKCTIHQYNMMLRNESYPRLLKQFFPGSVPSHVIKLFERIDVNYKLSEEVINVLIHYLKVNNLSWNNGFVEAIVTNMLANHVQTFEQAVDYIRAEQKQRQSKRKSGDKQTNARTGGRQKPAIAVVTGAETRTQKQLSDADYARILQKAKELESQ